MSYQKRACIRIPTSFKATLITPEGERHAAKVTNISVTGFQLSCHKIFAKNDRFVMQISLPKQTEVFELQVQVLRSRNLSEDRSDFACSLGLQIMDPPENWAAYAGQWIQAQLGSHTKRRLVAALLMLTAFVFAAKSALTALGLHALELSVSDFAGLGNFDFPILGNMIIFADVLLANLMLFCGLQVLHPSVRKGLFFTSTAAIGGVLCFAPRFILKLSLLQNLSGQKLIYFLDLFIFLLGLAGAIWARRLENRHQHLEYILSRENIYPPVQKSAKS